MSKDRLNNNIRRLRFDAGEMTQQQLADKVGVTRQTIGLIEGGGYNPTLNLCLKLAHATGKTLDELFWDQGD